MEDITLMAPDSKHLSLPKNWPRSVKTAVIHVVSLAHVAVVHTRGLLVNSANARTRLAGEQSAYTTWFNEHRPHQALEGCTPQEIYDAFAPLNEAQRFPLRPARTADQDDAVSGLRLTLAVAYHEGRRQLPIIELKRAA